MKVTSVQRKSGESKPFSEAEFCRVGDLARIFGLRRGYAYELEKRGKLRFVRLGERGTRRPVVLVKVEDVRRFIAEEGR